MSDTLQFVVTGGNGNLQCKLNPPRQTVKCVGHNLRGGTDSLATTLTYT